MMIINHDEYGDYYVDIYDDDDDDYHVDDYYDHDIVPPLQNEPHPR